MVEVLTKLSTSTIDDVLDRLLPWNQGETIPVLFVERLRRNSIELIIGHLESDGLMFRNFLRGFTDDKAHALLCGVYLNLRKVLRKLRELLWACKKERYFGLILTILGSILMGQVQSRHPGHSLVV